MIDLGSIGLDCLTRRLRGEKVSITLAALDISIYTYYQSLKAIDYDIKSEGKGTIVTKFGDKVAKKNARDERSVAQTKKVKVKAVTESQLPEDVRKNFRAVHNGNVVVDKKKIKPKKIKTTRGGSQLHEEEIVPFVAEEKLVPYESPSSDEIPAFEEDVVSSDEDDPLLNYQSDSEENVPSWRPKLGGVILKLIELDPESHEPLPFANTYVCRKGHVQVDNTLDESQYNIIELTKVRSNY